MSQLEDLAERQRRDAIASTARRAQTRQDQAQFFGSGGISASGGENIPATTLSNGPVRAGQPVPMLQAGGAVEYDTVSRVEPEEPINPVVSGRVIVLAYVEVNGIYQVWVGGDRKTPLKIAEVPIQIIPNQGINLRGQIEVLGTGRNDWAVALQYGNTVRMIYGLPSMDRQNWQITDPACSWLEYQGGGFWATSFVYLYNTDYYGTEIQLPDRPRNDAILVREGYHGATGGESTHSIEYYETIYVGGDNPSLYEEGTRRSGFDPSRLNDFPYFFSGTHEGDYITNHDEREYTGDAHGPGYLGPGGEPCDISNPETIAGSYSIPRFRHKEGQIYRTELNTQAYSFSAYAGNLELNTGTDTFFYRSEQFNESTDGPYYGGYIAQCQEYTSPTAYLWSIGGDGTGGGEEPTYRHVLDEPDVISSTAIARKIAPNSIKNIQISRVHSQPQVNTTPHTEGIFYAPRGCLFPGNGAFYRKVTHSGIYDFRNRLDSPHTLNPPNNTSISTTQIIDHMIYKNTDLEIDDNSALNSASFIAWKDDGISPYPVAYDVSPSQGFSQDDLFAKSIKFNVVKYEGALNSARLNYRAIPEGKEERAEAMKIGAGAVFLARRLRR
jgi:hypothetical protein